MFGYEHTIRGIFKIYPNAIDEIAKQCAMWWLKEENTVYYKDKKERNKYWPGYEQTEKVETE